MAITARQKDLGQTGSYQGLRNETETQPWIVNVDSVTTTRRDIINAGVLPAYFSAHPQNPLMTVRNIALSHSLGSLDWDAQIMYSSEPLTKEEKDAEAEPDPTKRDAHIEWVSDEFMLPIYEDVNGEPTLNSAGDYPDPPLEIETSRLSIAIEMDYLAIPSFILTHRNVTNLAPFSVQGLNIPAKAAKTSGFRIGRQKSEGVIDYFTVSFRLALSTELEIDWTIKMLDQGLHELEFVEAGGGSFVKKPIKIDGEDAKQPVLLNGSGLALLNPTPADAEYIEYDGYPERDFLILPGVDAPV